MTNRPHMLRNQHRLVWTPEHDDALRACVAGGLTYNRTAAEINHRFQTNYSRNAAIGRAGRLGVTQPYTPKRQKAVRPKPKPRRLTLANPPQPSFEQIQFSCTEIVPRNLALTDLLPGDCRYPYGDGPFLFCGNPKLEGSSYCGPHDFLTTANHRDVSQGGRELMRRAGLARHKRSIMEGAT